MCEKEGLLCYPRLRYETQGCYSSLGVGNPERHLPLLTSLVACGCTVVAPHFEPMVSLSSSAEDLLLRARRLRLSLNAVAGPEASVAGGGHSIGSTILLALAGATVWMRSGEPLEIAPDGRFDRLALTAPATGFFQAPGALDNLHTPVLVWVGTRDGITPPTHGQLLRDATVARVSVDLRVVTHAGHLSGIYTGVQRGKVV